jgi:type IV pilus biogenesis protein CpaD/CtpE
MLKKPTTMLLPVAVLALTACATNEPPRTAGTTVTTVPTTPVPATTSPGSPQVVVVEPGAAVRGDVRHTVAGRVESINRNASEITVTAADGSKMTLKLPPMAVATIREGDVVSMNVVVQPR